MNWYRYAQIEWFPKIAQQLPLFGNEQNVQPEPEQKVDKPKKKGLRVVPVTYSDIGDLVLNVNGTEYRYVITYPYRAEDIVADIERYNRKGYGKQIRRYLDWLYPFIKDKKKATDK